MASNVCKSSCACAHEFNCSICTNVARPEFVFTYVLYHCKSGMVGYCMHFYQSAFGTRLLCLCLSNCLAKVGSTIVFCKRIVSTTRQRFAVAYMSCSLDSATLLDQKTTVGNAGAGKNCLLCMHAHTNCILFWQASYQSLLGGVIVNIFSRLTITTDDLNLI